MFTIPAHLVLAILADPFIVKVGLLLHYALSFDPSTNIFLRTQSSELVGRLLIGFVAIVRQSKHSHSLVFSSVHVLPLGALIFFWCLFLFFKLSLKELTDRLFLFLLHSAHLLFSLYSKGTTLDTKSK